MYKKSGYLLKHHIGLFPRSHLNAIQSEPHIKEGLLSLRLWSIWGRS